MLGMSRVIPLGEDRFQQGKMGALNEVVNVDYSQTICLVSYQTELTQSRKFVQHKHRESFLTPFHYTLAASVRTTGTVLRVATFHAKLLEINVACFRAGKCFRARTFLCLKLQCFCDKALLLSTRL